MKRTRLVTAVLATAGVLGAAGVALGEPARSTELGGGKPLTYTWQATGSGSLALSDAYNAVGCQPGIHDCDDTLILANESGSITVKTSSTDPAAADSDLVIYNSDASGEPGTELQSSGGTTAEETVTTRVVAGKYYLVRIDFAISANGVVDGEATLKPSLTGGGPTGPSGPTGPGGADQPPTVAIAKPKKGKVKSISGTAADDKGITKVEVGFLTRKGKKCYQLTSTKGKRKKVKKCVQPTKFFAAKGTTAWSLKLRKPLKKGKWTAFARATDTAGQTQGGYGKTNRRTFKAK